MFYDRTLLIKLEADMIIVVVLKRQGDTLKHTKFMKTSHLMPFLVKVREISLVR